MGAAWPLKMTFKRPRHVKAGKKKRNTRQQRSPHSPPDSPSLVPLHQINLEGRFPLYTVGSKVEGMGSGAYEGKWYRGTIMGVKFHKNRGTFSYRIKYDRMPHKSYPISEQRLRRVPSAPFDAKSALNAIEFVPGQARHETRATVGAHTTQTS